MVRNNCRRCFEFAAWMQSHEPRVPSPQEVQGWLGLSLDQARRWRNDWLAARRRAMPAANLPHYANLGHLKAGGVSPV